MYVGVNIQLAFFWHVVDTRDLVGLCHEDQEIRREAIMGIKLGSRVEVVGGLGGSRI